MTPGEGVGGGVLIKLYTGRLFPEVQTVIKMVPPSK